MKGKFILTFLTSLIIMVTHCSIIPSSPEFGDDFGVEEGAFLKPEDFSGPLRKQPYGLVKEGVHRYPYPYYLQPRFLYEREPVEVQQGLDMIPPSKKRVTKGMLVDVMDFVTNKGPGGRNPRTGQDTMRSSGRKRK